MRNAKWIETALGALMLLLLLAASYDGAPASPQLASCQEKSRISGLYTCGSLPHRSF